MNAIMAFNVLSSNIITIYLSINFMFVSLSVYKWNRYIEAITVGEIYLKYSHFIPEIPSKT